LEPLVWNWVGVKYPTPTLIMCQGSLC